MERKRRRKEKEGGGGISSPFKTKSIKGGKGQKKKKKIGEREHPDFNCATRKKKGVRGISFNHSSVQ